LLAVDIIGNTVKRPHRIARLLVVQTSFQKDLARIDILTLIIRVMPAEFYHDATGRKSFETIKGSR